MMTQRIRVCPPVPSRGLLLLWLWFGAVMGCAVGLLLESRWLIEQLTNLAVRGVPQWGLDLVSFGLLGAPTAVAALWVALSMQRWRAFILCALLGGMMFVAAACAVLILHQDEPMPIPMTSMLRMGLVALAGGVLSATLAIGVLALVRVLLLRVTENTGDLCWRCAYPMHRSGATTCPECGTPVSRGRKPLLWRMTSVKNRSLFFGWALLAIIIGLGAWYLARQQYENRLFAQRFDFPRNVAYVTKFPQIEIGAFLPLSDQWNVAIVALQRRWPWRAAELHIYSGIHRVDPNVRQHVQGSNLVRRFDARDSRMILQRGLPDDVLRQIEAQIAALNQGPPPWAVQRAR